MTSESKTPKFSAEMRERAVRMVFEHRDEHNSQWAAIVSISTKIGCTAETLRRWVNQAERDRGVRPGTTTDERERLKALEREVRELRQANDILRVVAKPRFAWTHPRILPRRSSTAVALKARLRHDGSHDQLRRCVQRR